MTSNTMILITLLTETTALMTATRAQDYKRGVSEEVTRCVDSPDERVTKGGYKWCEYRVCALSFAAAVDCDDNVEICASHKCKRQVVDSAVWRCTAGIAREYFALRKSGCVGEGCMEDVRACACDVSHARRYHLEAEQAL